MRRALALGCLLFVLGAGCTHYYKLPPTASPQAQQAFALDGIVQRIDEFQTVVIDLAMANHIPMPTARIIVKWTVASTTAIGTSPQGWQATVQVGWRQVREEVAKLPQIANWVPLIDSIIGMGT